MDDQQESAIAGLSSGGPEVIQRLERLEAENIAQTAEILRLKAQRSDAYKRIDWDNRLLRVLILCIPVALITFDVRFADNSFYFGLKEPPTWVAAGFALSVIAITLREQELKALLEIGQLILEVMTSITHRK
jgi:hypothetical protein